MKTPVRPLLLSGAVAVLVFLATVPPTTRLAAVAAGTASAANSAATGLQQISPHAETGGGTDTGVFAPPISGPQSTLVGTVLPEQSASQTSPSPSGPQAFYVATVDSSGHTKYYKGMTDNGGRFILTILKAAAPLASVAIFRHFDGQGKPDQGSTCRIVGPTAQLEGTRTIQNPPSTGPAITAANTAYERGGSSQGIIQLQTRGIDPQHSQLLLNDGDHYLKTLAASDQSIVGKIDDNAPLGRTTLTVRSGTQTSNAQVADLVTQRFDPLTPMKTGDVRTVRLHIDGLGNDPATVTFSVSGSAMLVEGTPTKTVPVTKGQATVEIRAKEPGHLEIATILDVALPPIVAQELPTAGPPLPTPRPQSTEVVPTTTPVITPTATPPLVHASPTELGCSYHVYDGNLEPTQGVWQDDYQFDDHPGKQIIRDEVESKLEGYPVWDAQLPMAAGRNSLIFGIAKNRLAQRTDFPRPPGDRDHIAMTIYSDCKTFVPVRFAFTLKQPGEPDAAIWVSQVIRQVPLEPPRRPTVDRYLIDLPVFEGVPPPPDKPFTFKPKKTYRIIASLVSEGGAPFTGLSMEVHGVVKETNVPKVTFHPVYLGATPPPDLVKNTAKLAAALKEMIGDYYPIVPGSVQVETVPASQMTLASLYDPSDFLKQATATSFLGDAGRLVVVMDPHDYRHIDLGLMIGSQSLGEALAQKMVAVRDTVSYKTVMHELTHTFTYIWSANEMQAQCNLPGDYHNGSWRDANGHWHWHGRWAFGERMYIAGRPDRIRIEEFWPYMTETDQSNVYAAQCDFWNLVNVLATKQDPPVLLVRASLSNAKGATTGSFDPFYDLESQADLTPGKRGTWNIVVLGAGGQELAVYPIRSPFTTNEDERELPQAWVSYRIPDPAGAASIRLTGPGVTLTRALSAQQPAVLITSPSAGATLTPANGRVHIAWQANLPSGGKALATVLYGGDGTALIGQLFEATTSSFDVTLDPRAHSHVVKVVVTDGSRSGESTIRFSTP